MAMSQVPGLSTLMPEENRSKSYIKPTDSDYVKFAKQGGDRDLLIAHDIEKSTEPKPYAKVDWFDHIHNDEEDAKNRKPPMTKAPGKKEENLAEQTSARQEGSMIKEKYTRGGVPFHTDNMSVWERTKQHPESPMEHKNRRRPANSLF